MSIIFRALKRSQRDRLQEQSEAAGTSAQAGPEPGGTAGEADIGLRDRVRMSLDRLSWRLSQASRAIGEWTAARTTGQWAAIGGGAALVLALLIGGGLWWFLPAEDEAAPEDPMADVTEEVEMDPDDADEGLEEEELDEAEVTALEGDQEPFFPAAMPRIPGDRVVQLQRYEGRPTMLDIARDLRGDDALPDPAVAGPTPEEPADDAPERIEPGEALPEVAVDDDEAPEPEAGIETEAEADPDDAFADGPAVADTVPDHPDVEARPRVDSSRVIRVSRLSRSVRDAIQQGDREAAEQGLEELAEIRGENDRFTLKMRAYWAMHDDRYEDAEEHLLRVLDQRSHDVEAGLNLAIVEARMGRVDDARRRAFELRQRHPNEHRVQALLNRLGG